MSVFDLLSLLLALTAGFAWVNHRYLKLPPSIGILVMGLAASSLLVLLELAVPNVALYADVAELVRQIDFQTTVMNGLLAFLLFAGSLHVDFAALRSRLAVVGAMATMGVLLSTALVGLAMWTLAGLVGVELPLLWALVFGALISPTDPVAVLSTLKAIKVPQALETDMAGESLFNDGVGVVVFTALLALSSGGADVGAAQVAELFLVEALGGSVVGLISGYVAYRAMRAIDDYPVEVLISIALAMGCYSLASAPHMSGPIAVVVAGILVGKPRTQGRFQRPDAAIPVRLLDAGRPDSERGALSSHWTRGPSRSIRGVDPSSGARRDSSGARGPLRLYDHSRDPAS